MSLDGRKNAPEGSRATHDEDVPIPRQDLDELLDLMDRVFDAVKESQDAAKESQDAAKESQDADKRLQDLLQRAYAKKEVLRFCQRRHPGARRPEPPSVSKAVETEVPTPAEMPVSSGIRRQQAAALLREAGHYLARLMDEARVKVPVLSGLMESRLGDIAARLRPVIPSVEADEAPNSLEQLACIHQEALWAAKGFVVTRLLSSSFLASSLGHVAAKIKDAMDKLDVRHSVAQGISSAQPSADDFDVRYFFTSKNDPSKAVDIEPVFSSAGERLSKGIRGRYDEGYPAIIGAIWGALSELSNADGGPESARLAHKLNEILLHALLELESHGRDYFANSTEGKLAWRLFGIVKTEFDDFFLKRSTAVVEGQPRLDGSRAGRFNRARRRILQYCRGVIGIEEDQRFREEENLDLGISLEFYEVKGKQPSVDMPPKKIWLIEVPGYVVRKEGVVTRHRQTRIIFEDKR